ncbi:hypothetical protein W97_02243 [Coniosporium apollinis CBS 100218]|uniref:Glc8 protein n=1 Tax=Coniosporium apollinis (strain CBS 100218) TaxID=1168221 RepID=R7YM87_CONA1|nr:uncharacterized protein W97_02243 [Coniosporium apollinis CBS 100218]EON63017.1 hypothetical protein W97_02243 [Coniosporium apollinis CBS 100218]
MTQQSPSGQHSPPPAQQRPRGILKNSNSYQRSNSQAGITPLSPSGPAPLQPVSSAERPELNREMSEKEITLQNTQANAGPGHRRSSSNPRGPPSRRQSGIPLQGSFADENSPRLKWDEANLYLTEQQRDSTMKITEPKTPYARQYDPTEDEEEMSALNADELMVDELDKAKPQKKPTREDEIPDIDIGEPELGQQRGEHTPDSEKRVVVEEDMTDIGTHHGEEEDMTAEEREKHRKFEEMRRKHYEMRNVKNLLGHPEDLDDDDEDGQPLPPARDSNIPNGQ